MNIFVANGGDGGTRTLVPKDFIFGATCLGNH